MIDYPRTNLLADHDVLFLDFLGFAEAVQHFNEEKMNRLIKLVAAISEAQSEFDMNGEAQDKGSYKITNRPAITTFSDHIVMSFPCVANTTGMPDAIWQVVSVGWTTMVRNQMQNIAAQVTIAGLTVGLLVRGGLSRGKLYHHGGVVLGEAMIDAYRLESKVALNPRIAVSQRITDDLGVFTDADGQRCLDYIAELMLVADDRYGNARRWAREKLEEIEAAIGALTTQRRSREADKWAYFRAVLSHAMNTWPGRSRTS